MKNVVKEYREFKGLKQKELVAELKEICPGIDAPLVSKMEKGDCLPNESVFNYLSKALASDEEESLVANQLVISSQIKELLKQPFFSLVYEEVMKSSADNPVTKDRLRAITGKSEREIRDAVSQLRLAGARIGSSSSSKGYWPCVTPEQYKQLRDEYMARLYSIAAIVGAMDRNLVGQIEMELELG